MGIIISYIFSVGISLWILAGVLEYFGLLSPFLMFLCKNSRVLSKIGLFLVAIGFFMPFAEKTNVFELLYDLSRAASWLIDMGSYKFLVYLIFISSVIGVILLCLLFANKTISIILDWSTVIIANGSFLVLLIRLNNLANEVMGFWGSSSSGLKDLISVNLQIGAYFIIIGLILSFAFLLVASFNKDSNNTNNNMYPSI